jgi:hypothetical protein|tara:strand:+ start:8280 stop:9377 length:1098 start_codon:yes stop_codon:yes gene_type:complete
MSNSTISSLTELTAPVTDDLFLVVDGSENKKIKYGTVLSKAPDGTGAAPSIAFTNSTGTGLFRAASNELGFSAANSEVGKVTSTGFQLGTGTATAQLHLFSTDVTNDQLVIENSHNNSAEGPDVVLFRNSASADGKLLGGLVYKGDNSGGEPKDYGVIRASIIDETATEEDGKLEFQAMSAGTVTTRMVLSSSNVGIGDLAATVAPDNLLHVTSQTAGTAVEIECTAVSAASGADLLFRNTRNSGAGVTGDDISTITFQSTNAASEDISYASILAEVADASDSQEAGSLTFKVKSPGTTVDALKLDSTHATFGKPVVLAQGTAPTAVTAAGTAGELRWDTSYLYICLSTGTDSTSRWRRIAHSAF